MEHQGPATGLGPHTEIRALLLVLAQTEHQGPATGPAPHTERYGSAGGSARHTEEFVLHELMCAHL